MDASPLDALFLQTQKEDSRGAAYKTVATFAGLTRRKLWLRDGKQAQTDGHEIVAPFEHDGFYLFVEHEISHILFQSDGLAKQVFVAKYVGAMAEALKRAGMEFPTGLQRLFGEFVSQIIGVLEDVRCESLWGLLYPGSFERLQNLHVREVTKFKDRAHMSPAMYFIVLAAGVIPPNGRYSIFRPLFQEAMQKVERRSFGATLAVAKWLIQQLVTAELQRMRGALWNNLSESESRTPDISERFAGLKSLLSDSEVPSALDFRVNDVSPSKYPSKEEKRHALELADHVVSLNTANGEILENYLRGSEQAMMNIVAAAREALTGQVEVDDWITRNAFGKVNLKDVPPGQATPMSAEDIATLHRLRSLFYRVMGRRKYELQDRGTALDVSAYIESKLSREVRPCFLAEEKGRGFKALVLIDRSGSMKGGRTAQAERACRILTRALDFPFVEFYVWGFQSLENGVLNITRFSTKTKDFTFFAKDATVDGNTPLHLAMRVVNRFMETGSEAKQIICITDGFPTFLGKGGQSYGTKTLVNFVRDEVRHARRRGTNVTGVVVGREVGENVLVQMFGNRTHWQIMSERRFGDELVKLVSSSFIRYLRCG